jgi:hypothetical protein
MWLVIPCVLHLVSGGASADARHNAEHDVGQCEGSAVALLTRQLAAFGYQAWGLR